MSTAKPEETLVRYVVEIRRRESDGSIISFHRPLSPEDENTLKSWPSSGQAQLSHALFVEALRREAYTTLITVLSRGVHPNDIDPAEIEKQVRAHLSEMLDKFTESAVQETLVRAGVR